MNVPREGHTATLLRDGRVLVAGGSDHGTHTLHSAVVYDPATGQWTRAGNMTVPREAQVAVLMGSGKVLIAGGGRGDMPGGYIAFQNAEIFDPASGRFTAVKAPMVSDRVGAGAVLLNDGRVLIAGGHSSNADVYDPVSGIFEMTTPMRVALLGAPAVTLP